MSDDTERRREQRLKYQWPVWFAEDINKHLFQGQMVDIASGGAAFTCYTDQCRTWPGQKITARFSVPQFGEDDSFELASFTRVGHICRIDDVSNFTRKISIQFAEPLPFKPAEQIVNTNKEEPKLWAVTV